jgi:hypothetical protein
VIENALNQKSRQALPAWILAALLVLSASISLSIVHKNHYLLFGAAAVVLGGLLFKLRVFPVVLVLLVIAFADWAVESAYLPFQIMWLPELMSALLFLKSFGEKIIARKKYIAPGLLPALFFLLLAFFSLLLNSSGIIPALLMLRLLFRYYLLFLAVINLELEEKRMKLVISVLVLIFLAQLPLSVVKLVAFGQGERSLGLSSHAVTTIFPLIAIGFFYSFYFLYQKKQAYIWGIFAFVGFSIVGEKRAFIFYLPILLAFLTWILREKIRPRLRVIVFGLAIALVSFYLVARLIPTLNPQKRVWGDFSLRHIIDYAVSYETAVSPGGYPIGRVSATAEVFKALEKRGLSGLAFGYGPGSVIKSMFSDYNRKESVKTRFGVEYGWNGLSWLGIQVGYLGMLAYFFLFLYLLLRSYSVYKAEENPYWRSFAMGMVSFSFILLLTSLAYSSFFNHDAVAAFYFCLAALVMLRRQSLAEIRTEVPRTALI